MELIELSWGWISIHSQVIRWGGLSIGLGRAQFISGLHLLISDAIFILTHPPTHVHKCTLAHKGCPSYLFKDPSWAFALIWFVCFLSPSLVIFFYFTFMSHWDHNLKQLTCFHLYSESERRYLDSCASYEMHHLMRASKKHREHVCWPCLPFLGCQILTINPLRKNKYFDNI